MGASTGRKAVTLAPIPATFADGLPDHVVAYVRKVLPAGLRTADDVMRLAAAAIRDSLAGRLGVKDSQTISRRLKRLRPQ